MNEWRLRHLRVNLAVCKETIKDYLVRLDAIEKDNQTSAEERLLQIKKIREEINKVGEEIDFLKKEIMLINDYSVN